MSALPWPTALPASTLLRRLAGRLLPQGGFWGPLLVAGGGNTAGRALGFLFSLVLAGLFAPAEYGYVRWAISAAMLGAIPAAAGPYALACLLGAARDRPIDQRRLAVVGAVTVGMAALLCGLGGVAVLRALDRPAGGVLAVLVGMTWFSAAMAVYRGLDAVGHMAALYVGGNLLQLVLVLLLCGALGLAVPDLALGLYGFAWLGVLLFLERQRLAELRSSVRLLAQASAVLGPLGRLWAPLAVAQAGYTLWVWADVVLVDSLLGSAAAGQYALARTIGTVFLLVPEAAALVLVPYVAARGQAAAGTTLRLLAVAAAVSAGLLAGVLLVAPPLLTVLAGGAYAAATAPLPGVAVGMALYALYLVLEGHAVGAGRPGAHVAGILVMAAVMLGTGVLWLPALGVAGAGWACTAAALAGLATLVLFGYGPLRREA
jgi:O-antigen/teichoic acid export membrane protein